MGCAAKPVGGVLTAGTNGATTDVFFPFTGPIPVSVATSMSIVAEVLGRSDPSGGAEAQFRLGYRYGDDGLSWNAATNLGSNLPYPAGGSSSFRRTNFVDLSTSYQFVQVGILAANVGSFTYRHKLMVAASVNFKG